MVTQWAIARLAGRVTISADDMTADERARLTTALLHRVETRALAPRPAGRLYGGPIRTIRPAATLTGHEVDPPDPEPEEPTEFDSHHGWVRLASSGGTHYVYVESALTAYLGGDGHDIPDTDPVVSQHWWGHGEVDTVIVECTESDYSVIWSDLPTVTDGRYAWSLANAPNAGSGLCTGSSKIACQAVVGAGRSWASVLPEGWSADWRETGFVRRPNTEEWWAVRATEDDGLQMYRVRVPVALACITEWIADSVYSSTALGIARAVMLGAQIQPSADDVVLVVAPTDSEWESIYADGAYCLHPYCGWQQLWQQTPSSPAGMIQGMVLYSGGNYARTVEIDLTWDEEGEPQAAITVGSDQAWGGPPIRVPTLNGLETIPIETGGFNGPADVYGYTTPDGVVWLRCIEPGDGHVDTTSDDPWDGAVGCAGLVYSGSAATVTHQGQYGWVLHGAVSVDGSLDPETAIEGEWWSASATGGGSVTFANRSQYYDYPDCAGTWHDFSWIGDAEIQAGGLSAETLRIEDGVGGGQVMAVLFPTDPGVMILRAQRFQNGSYTRYANSGSSIAFGFNGSRRSYIPDGPIVETWSGQCQVFIRSSTGGAGSFNLWNDPGSPTAYSCSILAPYEEVASGSMSDRETAAAVICLSDGSTHDVDPDEWLPLYDADTEAVEYAPWAYVSAYHVGWQETPETTHLPTGMDAGVMSGLGIAAAGRS